MKTIMAKKERLLYQVRTRVKAIYPLTTVAHLASFWHWVTVIAVLEFL
jgi:hypothetical protein